MSEATEFVVACADAASDPGTVVTAGSVSKTVQVLSET